MTKNEQIIKHIESLSIGSKISVRKIAKDLNVSEGTAYRAIKDASQLGIVATIDRVGTVRIEKRSRENLDNLSLMKLQILSRAKYLPVELDLINQFQNLR